MKLSMSDKWPHHRQFQAYTPSYLLDIEIKFLKF